MNPSASPLIGLALSGGAARAAAHLGVLEAFEEAGFPIGAIAGTSAGSLVGALYASRRYRIDELIKQILELRWWSLVRPARSKQGLIDSHAIGQFLIKKLGPISFSDLSIPFAAVACDLLTGRKVVLRHGPLAPAVQASCSLPVVFTPTVIHGQRLVDGGYVSQIPIRTVKEDLRADRVIGVDVNYRGDETARPPHNLIFIAVHLASLWARKNADEEIQHADAVIRVDARGIGLTELHKAGILIERGREAARSGLKRFTHRLTGDPLDSKV